MVDIYLATLWLSYYLPIIVLMYTIQKPKRVVYFCQYYNEKGLKVDFVSLPAWQ